MRYQENRILAAAAVTMFIAIFMLTVFMIFSAQKSVQAQSTDKKPHTIYSMPEIVPSVWVFDN